MTNKRLYKLLNSLNDKDLYVKDFQKTEEKEMILTAFIYHDLVWVASDDRVLLTENGLKSLYDYFSVVDF